MNIWDKPGDKKCCLCGKGKAQLYSDEKDGQYISGACWNCLYK